MLAGLKHLVACCWLRGVEIQFVTITQPIAGASGEKTGKANSRRQSVMLDRIVSSRDKLGESGAISNRRAKVVSSRLRSCSETLDESEACPCDS